VERKEVWSLGGAAERAGDVFADDMGDVDILRSHEYALFGTLLARAPTAETLRALTMLAVDDSTPLGEAHMALARAAEQADVDAVASEYFSVFTGVGRGELLPYASFYMTGFLNDRPLAAVRQDLAALGIERVDGLMDPEDHAAILCDVMSALAAGQFESGPVSEVDFFRRHLDPWIARFFEDLTKAPSANFYAAVGRLGLAFIAVERQAFDLEDVLQ
jgi:TorA maturation chaperone TorD